MNFGFFQFLIKAGSIVIPFLWQNMLFSAVSFSLIWIITVLFKKRSPRWHYALWILVLVRLMLPPNFSFPFSGRNLLSQLSIYEKIFDFLNYLTADQTDHLNQRYELHDVSIEDQHIRLKQNFSALFGNNSRRDQFNAGLFLIWMSSVFLFLIIYLKKLSRFRSIIKNANFVDDWQIQHCGMAWRDQFNIKRSVQIVSSNKYLSPFTIGVLKPIIYLPQHALQNKHHLESIIAHEICHIKRYDNLWLIIQSLFQIMYFFNPIVWYVNSKISLSRECICDNMVLSRNKISATHYGGGIMTVLRLNLFGANEINVLPGFGSQRKQLIYRIKNLTGEKTMRKYQSWLIYFTLVLLGIFMLPMAGNVLNNSNGKPTQIIAAEFDVDSNDAGAFQEENVDFLLPLKIGKISAQFGEMKDPYTKKIVHHKGIDIAAPRGTKVFAAAGGKVEIADYKKGPGSHILLQHESGFQTVYSHCDTLLAQQDQVVKAGDVIALVGQTGRSTGPHLHFEIRKYKNPQNPQDYLDFSSLKLMK